MSLQKALSTWEDVVSFLSLVDHPQCFTVNYIPNEERYMLWIGNQPYETYDDLINSLYKETLELRTKLKLMENKQ